MATLSEDTTVLLGLLSQKCYHILTSSNPFNSECVRELLTTFLNWAIIIGAIGVKLPQILKIIVAGNVAGLNETSFVVEVFAGSLYVGYNVLEGYPFSAWGDVGFVALQSILLILLYWKYSHPTVKDWSGELREDSRTYVRLAYSVAWAFTMAVILGGYCPTRIVPFLGLVPVPCSIAGRIPQIYQNMKQKHTGQLSQVTLSLMLTGNLVRVFTTYHLNDPILLVANCIAALTNGLPLLQIFWYRKNTERLHLKKE